MKILLSGASSFTGYWFAKILTQKGHEVHALIRQQEDNYTGIRKKRIDHLKTCCTLYFDCPYGSPQFFEVMRKEKFTVFCHHAADVTNYKSPDFDPVSALASNAGPIVKILQTLKDAGCHHLLLTGSVFEQNEGAGSDGLRAVSPYGLSKGLTSDLYRYYCEREKIHLAKFVIPNPFGPFEEFRYTSFLVQNWAERKNVAVTMPSYVRDNIPVSLLAKAYVSFLETFAQKQCTLKMNPSCYPESQGSFTKRFADEMRARLQLPCEFTLLKQKDFQEPKVRINTDILDGEALEWDEEKAWDELADYYLTTQRSLCLV